jgi:hypothetical protein
MVTRQSIRVILWKNGDLVHLMFGPIVIDKSITILADPAKMIFISGKSQSRVFEIKPDEDVQIEGLKVICGDNADARCIRNEGNLTLKDMEFENSADPMVVGSMIENTGTLRIQGTANFKK